MRNDPNGSFPLGGEVGALSPLPTAERTRWQRRAIYATVGVVWIAAAIAGAVAGLFQACDVFRAVQTRYAIILFAATPTPGRKLTVVHLLYDATQTRIVEQFTLLGVRDATWIFLSDHEADKAVVQLMSVRVQNPVLGQLGKLVSTIVPKLPAAGFLRPQGAFPVFVSMSSAAPLPFTRATVSETDFVDAGTAQIDGSATFVNQPRTWLTVTAGAGVFAGPRAGDEQAAIENGMYVSDPLSRGGTIAGVTFHAPYDSSRPTPSRAERFGVVLAAVLTPALGVYVGPSYGWRGLAVTAGWAQMWIAVPPKPKQINDPVEDHEQLATGTSGRWLIAVSYAFGS